MGIDIDGDGSGFSDVTIVVQGVNLVGAAVTQDAILQSLVDGGKPERPVTFVGGVRPISTDPSSVRNAEQPVVRLSLFAATRLRAAGT